VTKIKLPILEGRVSTKAAVEALVTHKTRGLLVKRPESYRLYTADDILAGRAGKKRLPQIGHQDVAFGDIEHMGNWGVLSSLRGIAADLGGTLVTYACPVLTCKFRSPPKDMPEDGKCPRHKQVLQQLD
jgi:hypothetical protein